VRSSEIPLFPPLNTVNGAVFTGAGGTGAIGAMGAEIQNYLAYGEQLYGESRYEEALPYLQYAAEMDPSNARALQVLGHCQYGLGKTAEALQCYETALSLSPEDEALREWVEQFKQGANA
jgi:tetratricopeptide (TPR) repeat protein